MPFVVLCKTCGTLLNYYYRASSKSMYIVETQWAYMKMQCESRRALGLPADWLDARSVGRVADEADWIRQMGEESGARL